MKYLLLALFICLPAGAQITTLHPQHNRYYPKLRDDEALSLYKDFLATYGISGKCHQTGRAEEEMKWKFREYQGNFVAEAINTSFVSKAGQSWKVEFLGPTGNLRILTGRHKIFYHLTIREQGDEYKFDVSSGKLDFYTETDNGPDIAGLCLSAQRGDQNTGKPEKVYAAKPDLPEPPPKPAPRKSKGRVKPVKAVDVKVCPLENELTKEFLLSHDARILAKRTNRESEIPQVIDFEFVERQGKLYARTKNLFSHEQFTLLIEGGFNSAYYPVNIGECEDFSVESGKGCGVQIQFPKVEVATTLEIYDRTGEKPPAFDWDCRAKSYDNTWWGRGFSQNCEIVAIEKVAPESQRPVTVVAQAQTAPLVPKCRLESASGD